MSLTPSTMIPLGTVAPDFSLLDINGKTVSLSYLREAKAYLVAFICVHCPYVKHLEKKLAELGNEYQQKGVAVVAINSNDPDYNSDDSVEGMREQAQRLNFSFPYLVDESQDIARSYQAACTPDLYVFNSEKKLVYHGQFDDTRPGSGTPTGKDLKAALNAVIGGGSVETNQRPSSGCNIKWKN